MSQAAITQKSIQRFTAVDLVTIAVFGVLWRAMWYVWNIFAFLFPFNQVLNTFFGVLAIVAALVIVRKPGTATLLAIAAGLVNIFLQGEVLTVVAIGAATGILADLYCYFLVKAGRDPFSSFRDMLIAGTLTAVSHNLIMWIILLKFVFKVPMENSLVAAVFAAGTVGGIIGGGAGFSLGKKIKGLIG